MEYMTVLKRPDIAALQSKMEEGGLRSELRKTSWKSWLGARRLCSQALFIGVMLVLMLVMFVSQLIVHVQLQELRGQVDLNKQNVDDMLEAALIEKYINDQRARSQYVERKDRHRKRHDPNPPVYFGLRGGGTISGQGVFQWDDQSPNSIITRSDILPKYSSVDSRKLEKLEIGKSGLYSITVQINVNGRSNPGSIFTPVGYWICKDTPDSYNNRIETRLDKVFLTQDGRGQIRQIRGGRIQDPPVDSLTYSGSFYLKEEDRIYIKRPNNTRNDNTIIFDNGDESAHFTGLLTVPE